MEFQGQGTGSPNQPLPRTLDEGACALGHQLAYPVGADGETYRVEIRSSDRSPDAQRDWVDSITLVYGAPLVRVTTERRDRREIDLTTAAEESLSGSWPFDPASGQEMEAWLLDRTHALETVPTQQCFSAATVDGQSYSGVHARHGELAAWAVDVGEVRISASGPVNVIEHMKIAFYARDYC